MTAPAVVITVALEARPKVTFDCMTEGERSRLLDWLGTHEAVLDLVYEAVCFQDETTGIA